MADDTPIFQNQNQFLLIIPVGGGVGKKIQPGECVCGEYYRRIRIVGLVEVKDVPEKLIKYRHKGK